MVWVGVMAHVGPLGGADTCWTWATSVVCRPGGDIIVTFAGCAGRTRGYRDSSSLATVRILLAGIAEQQAGSR